MSSFEFVLGLVGILFGYKLVAAYLEQRASRDSTETDSRLGDALDGRLTELEDRVRVLERIVTDKRFDLDREFEDLTD